MVSRSFFGATAAALLLGLVTAIPAFGQQPSPAASTVPPTAPAATLSDPRCDTFLTSAEVEAALTDTTVRAVEFFDSRPGGPTMHITCHWRTSVGQEVYLDIDDLVWSGQPFLITKHSSGAPVEDLGDAAFAVTESGSNYVAWAGRVGDIDRTLLLYGYERPHDELIELARQVRADVEPGDVPMAPGASSAATAPLGADPLLGDWLLSGWSEGALPEMPAVTFSFGGDGSSIITVDCKPAKGSEKPVFQTTYTVSGDQLERAPADGMGQCRKAADREFVQMLSFVTGMATRPGAWSVTGDTLTIEGSAAPGSLTLTRVTAP
jgi:hypothetical protein